MPHTLHTPPHTGAGYNEDGTPAQEYDPLSNWEGSQVRGGLSLPCNPSFLCFHTHATHRMTCRATAAFALCVDSNNPHTDPHPPLFLPTNFPQNPVFAPGGVALRVDGGDGDDGDDAASVSNVHSSADDDDYRWAVTVFEFVGEGEDELSVSAAERVKAGRGRV
jgi:hypothetical protein